MQDSKNLLIALVGGFFLYMLFFAVEVITEPKNFSLLSVAGMALSNIFDLVCVNDFRFSRIKKCALPFEASLSKLTALYASDSFSTT